MALRSLQAIGALENEKDHFVGIYDGHGLCGGKKNSRKKQLKNKKESEVVM